MTTISVERDGVIVLSDDGALNTYTIAYEPGDLTINVPDTNGDQLHDDAPMGLSFSAYLRNVQGANFATLLDIAHRYAGGHVASEWVSTTAGDVFTVTCSVIFSGAELGEADEQLDFPFCVVRASLSEGDPNTVNVTITSYATKPTRV